jgi:2-polyprenyl-3-methyl-5-hydroxy-6-metoxy-1,4-benzoquinol methylase
MRSLYGTSGLDPLESTGVLLADKIGGIWGSVYGSIHNLGAPSMIQLGTLVWSVRIFRSKLSQKPIGKEDKQRALSYYKQRSHTYNKIVEKGFLMWFRNREREAVLRFADLHGPGQSMIDIGCGGGFYALKAKEAGKTVVAVDVIPAMLEHLKTKVDKVLVSDVESLDLEGCFDTVLCVGVLDFVVNPHIAFQNLARLVSPGGKLVILVPRFGMGGWIYRVEKWLSNLKVNLYSAEWFSNLAKENHLNLIEVSFPLPNNMVLLFRKNSMKPLLIHQE